MTLDSSFKSIVKAFDRSWCDGTTPSIDVAVQDAARQQPQMTPDERRRLLTELIHVDLRYRWQRQNSGDKSPHTAGDPTATVLFSRDMLLESYLERFPELQGHNATVAQLSCCRIRGSLSLW